MRFILPIHLYDRFHTMDGDHSAKSLDAGANSATKGGADFTEAIHEGAHQAVRSPHRHS